MNNDERIERLLLALEVALKLVDKTMAYTVPMYFDDISNLNSIYDSYAKLEALAKQEREKQGTINESDKKVGE